VVTKGNNNYVTRSDRIKGYPKRADSIFIPKVKVKAEKKIEVPSNASTVRYTLQLGVIALVRSIGSSGGYYTATKIGRLIS